MRQVLAEAPGPIHPVILLEVPSVKLVPPVFFPVLLVTLEVPLPLLFLSVLPLLSLLLLLVLATLRWAPSSSMWHRLADRPLGRRLGAKRRHRLGAKSTSHVASPFSLSVRSGTQAFFLQPLRVEESTKDPVCRKGELHNTAGVVSSSDSSHLACLEEHMVSSEG